MIHADEPICMMLTNAEICQFQDWSELLPIILYELSGKNKHKYKVESLPGVHNLQEDH
jgi:hypothetical protein